MIVDSSAVVAVLHKEPGQGIEVLPFDEPDSGMAVQAFLDFGKGRHPARLNYGDCMTYATVRRAGRPLLFTGADFAQTDIQAA